MNKQAGRARTLRRVLALVLVLVILAAVACLGLSAYVCSSVRDRVLTQDQAAELDCDCILVLGAAIWENDTPCPMLADRLDQAIALYHLGASEVLLMSGDEADRETTVMRDYALAAGVPEDAIVLDPEGYSTFESVQRAKEVFGERNILLVTQGYHLYRALYIARQMGLEAWGVAADPRRYAGQVFREAREVLARDKDFFQCRGMTS